MFIRKEDTLTIIGVHVEDLMILAKNISEMKRFQDSLKLQFKIKDMRGRGGGGRGGCITLWEFVSFKIRKQARKQSRAVHRKDAQDVWVNRSKTGVNTC